MHCGHFFLIRKLVAFLSMCTHAINLLISFFFLPLLVMTSYLLWHQCRPIGPQNWSQFTTIIFSMLPCQIQNNLYLEITFHSGYINNGPIESNQHDGYTVCCGLALFTTGSSCFLCVNPRKNEYC